MTESITRCPKCKTSFRVNEEHLKTARGAVRCGSCLNIFNAKEHLIKVAKPEQTQPEKTEEDDDILISDDMPDEEGSASSSSLIDDSTLDSNVFIAKTATKAEINLFERRIKDAERHERDHVEADESWALNLLEDDEDSEKELGFAARKNSDQESAEGLTNRSTKETEAREEEKDSFSSVFQVLEESGSNESGIEPFPGETFDVDEQEYASFEEEYEQEQAYENAFENHSNNDFLESFEPEPLELHVKNKVDFFRSNGFFAVLSSIALITFFVQLAYYNFDSWGRSTQFRPYYAHICRITGCTLPILQDLSRVKVDNMIVIAHPKTQGMLLVDATLHNRASFDQYFPTLLLTFTSLSGELVSKHVFPPKEYVGGELAGKNLMPSKRPIHITLEINDPGEEAVNYQISIVKP